MKDKTLTVDTSFRPDYALLRAFNRLHWPVFEERFRDVQLVAIYREEDEDGRECGIYHHQFDTRDYWAAIVCGEYPVAVCTIETVDHLRSILVDNLGDHCLAVMLRSVWEKEEQERKRLHLERAAANLAARHDVEPCTLEFLQAIEKERRRLDDKRDDWRNPEARMERWGACAMELGSARGSEVFFEDNDYMEGGWGSENQELDEIEEWVSRYCPLLWLQWEEYRLKADQEDGDDDGE